MKEEDPWTPWTKEGHNRHMIEKDKPPITLEAMILKHVYLLMPCYVEVVVCRTTHCAWESRRKMEKGSSIPGGWTVSKQ